MLHCLSLPTPFSVGPVNVYLAEGDPLTLIDTGPKWDETRAALEAGLAERGHRVEDIRRIVLTHHHVDHIGLAGEIVARSGAEVLTHPYNTPWLTNYAAYRETQKPFYRVIWRDGGVPKDIVLAMDAAGATVAQWLDPVTPTREINEGDVIDLGVEGLPLGPAAPAAAGPKGAGGVRDWRVYHTPGHAGGLICLWEPESRTLLANDHLIRDISSNPLLEPPPLMNGPRPRRLVEYLHHMQRMAALEPRVALPGHGAIVEDVPGLVRQRLAFHQRRKERILNTLDGRPQTLWELTQGTFGERLTRGMDWFLGCSEILGHLDLLEADGTARPERDGALVKWIRIGEARET
jgi:glyoxylase-like metal-dependent hydrolase (beta-lactamase superfamily II)